MRWPRTERELVAEQERLAAESAPKRSSGPMWPVAGCFVCFGRERAGGTLAGHGFAAAALIAPGQDSKTVVVEGEAGGRYRPGLLALREGALLEGAVRALPRRPRALLVNATGRDHPRRAGMALHLGAILDLPTVGVTHRPFLADGDWPEPVRGEHSPLTLDGEMVGHWLVLRDRARPLAVHPAWRTDPELAIEIVLAVSSGRARTPMPLRLARQAARLARAEAERRARST